MSARYRLSISTWVDLELAASALLMSLLPLAVLLMLGGVDLATSRGRQALVASTVASLAIATIVPVLQRERANANDGRGTRALIRGELSRVLAYEGPRSLRQGVPVTLISLDIGALPSGRPVDEHLLLHISSVLRGATREDMDRVYPCSLHEVHVVLPGIDSAGAVVVADRIISRLHSGSLELVGERLDCAIGIATFERERPDVWLQRAVTACRLAADGGGGMEIAGQDA